MLDLAALGAASAEIAHELRNALSVISAATFVAQRDPATAAPQLARIERQARAAQGVVDGILSVARGDRIAREAVPLGELLGRGREGLPDGVARFVDEGVDECILHAHATLLSRVLRCLYENAVQAAATGRATITTTASREQHGVRVRVEDDGPGIPEHLRASLFEPLVSARPGGTGLGLSLARRIVEAHGGTLRLAESVVGARFDLYLPD